MSEFGIKIKNIEASTLFEYNNGVRDHYEYKDAIGLFIGRDLITPAYNFEKQFESYDGADIRDILIPQSIDEIHEKIKSVKDAKSVFNLFPSGTSVFSPINLQKEVHISFVFIYTSKSVKSNK